MHKVPGLQVEYTGRSDNGKGLVNSCTSHNCIDNLICLMVAFKSEMSM